MNKSQELYIRLLNECSEIKEFMKKTSQYHSFLTHSAFNMQCEEKMFECGIIPRQQYFKQIPGLENECKKCWAFYLNPRNKSIKQYDIIYGKKFEFAFLEFLNKSTIPSAKADRKNAILPDNLIFNKIGKVLAYYEVKYHNAPFVWRYKYTEGRECYEGSITMDYEKVKNQMEKVRKLTKLPVFYLHWVDFPCIKGVFYMTLEDTQKKLKLGIEFKRKGREGDYIISEKGKKKVGYQNKFYPSILEMKNLEHFINLLKSFDGKRT